MLHMENGALHKEEDTMKKNPYSRYGCFWFNPECLEFADKKNNSIQIPEKKENKGDQL